MTKLPHLLVVVWLLAPASLPAQVPGSLDTNFVPATATSEALWSVAIQRDGRILAAGREDVSGATNPPCSLPIRFSAEFFRLRN